MSDPISKYGLREPTRDLVFFNYHEYLVSEYQAFPREPESDRSDNADKDSTKPSLVVTHFPNPYAVRDSDVYKRTRVVRIPRVYHTCEDSYIVPQFSTFYPGREPAALTSKYKSEYVTEGEWHGWSFGTTSLTPLVPRWLSESELKDIVDTLNKHVYDACSLHDRGTWLDNALDLMSGSLYSLFFTQVVRGTAMSRKLDEAERYVQQVNVWLKQRHPDLKLISLVRNAMLSLDFQVPMAQGVETQDWFSASDGTNVGADHGKES